MARRNSGASLEWREERQVWEIIWYEHGRRRRSSTGTRDRREADQALAKYLLDTKPVSRASPAERRIDDALTDYLLAQQEGNASAITAGYNVKALLGFWSGKKVADITEDSCAQYVVHRKGKSKSTISRELSMLAAALHLDKKKGRLVETVHVWKPGDADPRDVWLTRREAAILIWHARKTQAKAYLPFTLLFLLYTSPRKTAALTLRWTQVDFRRGLIDFNPPGRQRTKKGRPIIPIPERLMPFLRYARRRSTEEGYVFHRKGKPIANIRKGVEGAACKAAKYCRERALKTSHDIERDDWLQSAMRLEATTSHVLRHTSITWLAQADVPFGAIARYAGHKSSRTTEKVYAHHSPSYLKQVTQALDRRR